MPGETVSSEKVTIGAALSVDARLIAHFDITNTQPNNTSYVIGDLPLPQLGPPK